MDKILQLILRAVDDSTPVIARISEEYAAMAESATAASTEASAAMERSATTTVAAMDEEKAALVGVDKSMASMSASANAASAETTAAMERSAVATEASATRSASANSKHSKSFNGVALGAAAVEVAIGLLADKTVKAAGDFQSSLTRLVTSAGETNANLKLVGEGMLKVESDTGTGAKELGEAMYVIESGGQHGAAGLLVLKAAAQGAKAENAELKVVADAVTSVLQDYHLKAEDSAVVTSKLVAAVGQGKTTFQDFSSSLHSILPLASSTHESLNDIMGALAAMTVHGMSADQAAQNLNDTLKHMVAPTQVQTKELGQLGLSSSQLADMVSSKGLTGTLQTLSETILKQMGPSGRVLLNAFNQSKDAANDTKLMIESMPPSLQNLAKQYQAGAISVSDYREAIKDLPTNQAVLMQQFASLQGRASGFNDLLKTGAPAAQTYQDALRRVTGDATGLTTALMLTGENTDYVNNAVKTVTKATAEAGNNVKGWSEIQGNFNQKLSVAKANLQATGIAIGTALLPAATAIVAKFGEWLIPLAGAINAHKQLFTVSVSAAAGLAALVLVILGVKKAIDMTHDAAMIVADGTRVMARVAVASFNMTGVAAGAARSAVMLLQATVVTPVALAITIGAALAAIAYVMAKVRETQDAIKGVEVAQQRDQDVSLGLYKAAQRVSDPAKRAKLIQLANTPPEQLDKNTQFWAGFKIPGFASGVRDFQGGAAVVGENGPELVTLPKGSNVFSNQETKGMQMGGNVNLTVNVGTFAGTQAEFDMLASKIYQSLMRTARANGASLPAIGVRPL